MMFPKARILLVDDEPLVLDMFEEALSAAGHEVLAAHNSFEAVKTIRDEPIDMIISDVRLHPFDGFDLMARAQEKNPQLPVILMTGAPREGDEQLLKGRNTVYLIKPISLSILEEVVTELLRQSMLHKDKSKHAAS